MQSEDFRNIGIANRWNPCCESNGLFISSAAADAD